MGKRGEYRAHAAMIAIIRTGGNQWSMPARIGKCEGAWDVLVVCSKDKIRQRSSHRFCSDIRSYTQHI